MNRSYLPYEPSQLNRYGDGLRAGRPEFDPRQEKENSLFSTTLKLALESTRLLSNGYQGRFPRK
jgi:hypothetical protein